MQINLKRVTILLISSLYCVIVLSQNKFSVLTVEEMKKGYLSQDSLREACEKELAGFDLYESKRETFHIVPNKALRNAGGLNLPPSKYVVRHERNCPEELCWVEPLDKTDANKNEHLRKSLVKKYGECTIGDTLLVVPAKWLTGTLVCTGWLRTHGGMLLSASAQDLTFIDGVEQEYSDTRANRQGSLQADIRKIVDADSWLQGIVVLDGPKLDPATRQWKDKVERWQEMQLLSRDVNRLCTMRTERRDPLLFTILLSIDSIGKTHLHLLQPTSPNEREAAAIRELSAAIEQQPAGILQKAWTYDGRLFPGVYINARLSNRGWELTDVSYDYHQHPTEKSPAIEMKKR